MQTSDDWQRIHERLMELSRAQAAMDYEIDRWLLAALRARVDERLGYASVLEYGERLFGYTRRVVAERLRVGRALETLPRLGDALRTGRLCWSAVRELSRVAIADNEQAWIEAAGEKTVREIEAMVSGRQRGDDPDSDPRPEARRHVVRFEVSAATLALVREAQAVVTRQAGGHLSDDEVLSLMARQILGGPADDGRAGYQVAVTVCRQCAQTTQQGNGVAVVLDEAAAATVTCDAQVIDLDAAPERDGAKRARTHVGAPELDAGTAPQNTHVGARPHVGARARQTIPPATRRLVMRRDGGRCVVPGCTHTIVDCHHLDRRADGGGDGADNLALLCGAHHAQVHRGTLVIEGAPSTGLRFRHADGTAYGGLPEPAAAQACSDAFLALVTLGYSEREARAGIEAARCRVGAAPAVEAVVRAALIELRPAA
jgi:hypothetical protein